MVEMEDILISMTVVFSSPQSGDNVEKHFCNLQNKMLNIGISEDMTVITDEDVEVVIFLIYIFFYDCLLKVFFFLWNYLHKCRQ